MTTGAENDEEVMCCAACGIAGVDVTKLKDCSDCDLFRYCGVECQKEHMAQRDHRPKDKQECQWGADESLDEILFKQPESSCFGDCPICFLPLPIDHTKSDSMSCCSKRICMGCNHANKMRSIREELDQKCPFCRHPLPKSKEEVTKNIQKRVEANDPEAMRTMGGLSYGEGDYKSAFRYSSKAAELGEVSAHFQLSCLYGEGEGVEKDKRMEVYHSIQAAIGGHPTARHNLGSTEWINGRYDRAVKHFIIAAKLGQDESLETLKQIYTKSKGWVSKEDFASALRAHQAAIYATKSPQREAAVEFERMEHCD